MTIASLSVEAGFLMTERSAWLSILLAAFVSCRVGVAARADEPSGAAQVKPAETRPKIPPRRVWNKPGLDPKAAAGDYSLSKQRSQAADTAMPPAVSSAIERFVSQSGLDLPMPAAPHPRDSVKGSVARTSRIPPPLPFQAGLAGPSRSVRDLPPALPPHSSQEPGGVPRTGGPTSTTPSPLAERPKLKPAPFAPEDLRFPITLAVALKLSDARPLIVAAAQARTWIAEAELAKAKVLWIPDINIGADYIRHDGGGPDFNKGVMTAPSVNFFYGGAALWGLISTCDAVYEPLAKRQILNARVWDIQTAKNDALLETAKAYFLVHQYRGMYAGSLFVLEQGHRVFEKIAGQRSDLIPAFEVDRIRNMIAGLEQQSVAARQEWRVQSARLTKVLRLDPRAVVEPLEHDHLQITLIDPAKTLDDLMPIALFNRPELASRRALVQAAEVRVRQEKARPLLPFFALTGYQSSGGMLIQAGLFGIGPNSSLNQWAGRDDISVQLAWQLENFGLGNLARIKKQRGEESRAIVELRNAQDRIAEEVNQAQARVQASAVRIVQADRALRTGMITLNGSIEGMEHISRFGDVLNPITRPQEAVYALQLLQRAIEEYFTTVAAYNRAQFELFHALGYPAYEISTRRPPGDIVPVDTGRPPFLPPVGNGPPPATE